MKKSLDSYLLLVFVIAAGLLAMIYALQFFGLLTPFLGPKRFFSSDLLGGLAWAAAALGYLWLAIILLKGNAGGLAYATILSLANLALVLITFIGGTAFRVLLPACVLNGLVLLYAALPGTKKIFKG